MDRVLTPGRAVVAAGVIGFLAALLTGVVSGIPVPQIHDEWSYLLGADTYAHGRLTNPPHPMGAWLDTFDVLQQPTYMSKYPPGQGFFLMLGVLAGLTIAGVWLSAALACAAVTWMLLPWMSARWALAGGALLALHPTMLGWSHSYWGAAVAILGGALTVGTARRLIDGANVRDSLLLGAGVVILANSRPWEGFVLVAALIVVALAMRLLRMRALVPALVIVAIGGAFMLYDNWRVTRDPLLMPYALYERRYNFTPPLAWQKTHPVVLRQKTMRHITESWAYDLYRERHSVGGFLLTMPKALVVYVNGAFQFVPDTMLVREPDPVIGFTLAVFALLQELPLLVPLFFLPAALRRDRMLRAVAIVAGVAFAVALLPAVVPLPHYGGPLVGSFVLLWLAGVREIVARWGARRVFGAIAVAWVFGIGFFFVENRPWRYRWDEVAHRLDLIRDFSARPGRHLVLVRYLKSHNPHCEWVWNAADIDAQHVVWAHDFGDNAALVRYYADRAAWSLTVGDRETTLEPYGRSPAPALHPAATPAPPAGD